MSDGLEQVRVVIGSVDECGISDTDIKNALWNNYFAIEETVQWALGIFPRLFRIEFHPNVCVAEEQERRNAAKERKGKVQMLDIHLSFFFLS